MAIPVSALVGDNVVDRSDRMPWYTGPTLLEFLEEVPVGLDPRDQPFRLPVQYVNRPRTAEFPDFRGYSGRISSGAITLGDEVAITSLGRTTTVTGIEVVGEPAETAFAPQSVTLQLADDIDIDRGDVIAAVDSQPRLTREISATICVLSDKPISTGQRLLARVGPKTVRAIVGSVQDRLDLETLEHAAHTDELTTNDVGTITLRFADDVAIDEYNDLRTTGAFILVDDQDGSTLAGGMARA